MKNQESYLTELYRKIELLLYKAMEIQSAKFGAIQIFDPLTQSLQIVLQKGFENAFIEPFMKLSPTCNTVCARTFRLAGEIMIADIEVDSFYKESFESGIELPFKAVHCSPIFNSYGVVIGILNTHYDKNLHLSKSEIEVKETIAEELALLIQFLLIPLHSHIDTSQNSLANADTIDLGNSLTK